MTGPSVSAKRVKVTTTQEHGPTAVFLYFPGPPIPVDGIGEGPGELRLRADEVRFLLPDGDGNTLATRLTIEDATLLRDAINDLLDNPPAIPLASDRRPR